jgi:hypothetical protein
MRTQSLGFFVRLLKLSPLSLLLPSVPFAYGLGLSRPLRDSRLRRGLSNNDETVILNAFAIATISTSDTGRRPVSIFDRRP